VEKNKKIKTQLGTFFIIVSLVVLAGVGWYLLRQKVIRPGTRSQQVLVQYEDVYPPIPSSSTAPSESVPSLTPSLSPPTLESIFDGVDASASISADQRVELLVTGDVLLARSVNNKVVQLDDPTWPFLNTADQLAAADIVYANLETPLTSGCPRKIDGMIFCGDPMNIKGLQFAGVDIVNFANNHAGNQTQKGVDETVKLLKDGGFQVTGVEGLVTRQVRGTNFGFLGFNDVDRQVGVAHADNPKVMEQISQARPLVDVLIVQFHWGEEYRYQPTWRQEELAHLAVSQGADLVVSNHPHWFQPVEIYQGKVIMYSHGNFIFDQMWSRETREGVVGKYTFDGKNLIDVEFLPVYIEGVGQPRWMEGSEKSRVLEKLKKESIRLQHQ